MRYYAVIDTNVLVSSLLTKNPNSATVKILYAIVNGDIVPLYNHEIYAEYEEVLRRAKFPFCEDRIQGILRLIRQYGITVTPSPTGEMLTDPDDLVFYEIVMEKREDDAFLVTGNKKHFPEREFIVTPAEMMTIIEGE
ncbi:MAG: putative toxin-antitoxin system toxin component, PIN family [Lachnospiraceae bacterium]|nr:putative toxin-antitoxin system toxin component, PIN family [Lachnospiraceae bacterium]